MFQILGGGHIIVLHHCKGQYHAGLDFFDLEEVVFFFIHIKRVTG